MPDLRDPLALLRHATGAGDLQLLELVRSRLLPRPQPERAGRRAYETLVGLLQLREQTHAADDGREDDSSG